MFQNIIKNALTLIISIAFVLLLLELLIRPFAHNYGAWQVAGIFKLDDKLIYSLKPKAVRKYETEEFTEIARTNAFSLRGPEIRPRDQALKRVLVLGDSFTFGHGVADDQTYPFRLQKVLRSNGKNIEVVNAGVPGYGTDQSYKYYTERLSWLKPELVVFSLNANDIEDNINLPLFGLKGDRLYPINAKKNWLYFLTTTYMKAPDFLAESALFNFVLSRLKDHDIFFQRPFGDRPSLVRWSRKKIIREIESLNGILLREKSKLVVAMMPRKNGAGDLYGFAEEFLKKKKVPFLNLDRSFDLAKERETLFFAKDSHPNESGYAVIAQELGSFLSKFL